MVKEEALILPCSSSKPNLAPTSFKISFSTVLCGCRESESGLENLDQTCQKTYSVIWPRVCLWWESYGYFFLCFFFFVVHIYLACRSSGFISPSWALENGIKYLRRGRVNGSFLQCSAHVHRDRCIQTKCRSTKGVHSGYPS